MGEKDEMDANPPGSDEEDASEDAATAASGQGDMEEEANLAGLSAQLRGLYKGLLDEPIPDRFTQLLKELESKESETK
jgi:Anti-sigma factor NepR